MFPDKTTELLVEVDLVAEMTVFNPFDFFLEPSAEKFPFQYEPPLLKELAPFLEVGAPAPRTAEYLKSVDRAEVRSIDFLVNVNRRLSQEIKYVIRMEAGVQSPEETLRLRSGSCRDTGWLLVHLFRHLGLAARFVSGYLIQLKAGREGAGRPLRHGNRFHRPPRLVRSLSARRRLDRPRPDFRSARGRRSHPARLHARAFQCRAD